VKGIDPELAAIIAEFLAKLTNYFEDLSHQPLEEEPSKPAGKERPPKPVRPPPGARGFAALPPESAQDRRGRLRRERQRRFREEHRDTLAAKERVRRHGVATSVATASPRESFSSSLLLLNSVLAESQEEAGSTEQDSGIRQSNFTAESSSGPSRAESSVATQSVATAPESVATPASPRDLVLTGEPDPKPARARKPKPAAPERSELCEAFLLAYPRRTALQEARKAWKQVHGDECFALIMQGLRRQEPALLRAAPEYRPHPATWLRGRRWEDGADTPAVESVKLTPGEKEALRLRGMAERMGVDPDTFARDPHAAALQRVAAERGLAETIERELAGMAGPGPIIDITPPPRDKRH